MIEWLWNIVPPSYRWSVAIKKISYTVVKFGIGALAGTSIGMKVKPEHWEIVTTVFGGLAAGGLTMIHDWAQVKWPHKKWL